MTTPPTDYKKLAEEALANGAECEFDDDILKALARAVLALDEENGKLEKKFSLAAKLVNRAPFCSDCRDKVDREICYRCENQRLRAALERVECTEESYCQLQDGVHHPDPSQHDERCSYRIAREALERK